MWRRAGAQGEELRPSWWCAPSPGAQGEELRPEMYIQMMKQLTRADDPPGGGGGGFHKGWCLLVGSLSHCYMVKVWPSRWGHSGGATTGVSDCI